MQGTRTNREIADRYSGTLCTLDGQTAKITGRLLETAWIVALPDGRAIEFSWPTVQHVMTRNAGAFAS